MLLAYDQGFEHGPTDFDDRSVDPKFILDLTKNGLVYWSDFARRSSGEILQ